MAAHVTATIAESATESKAQAQTQRERDGGTQAFYDALAADYHLVFADWNASIKRQAGIIKALFDRYEATRGREAATVKVLDCACGIGTQALGLAQLGFDVTASDLSPAEVARAEAEATARGVTIRFEVCNFQHLEAIGGKYQAVLAFDNALAHCLTDAEILAALRSMVQRLDNEDSVLLLSIRDYDDICRAKPSGTLPNPSAAGGFTFQKWDWFTTTEGYDAYQLHHFTMKAIDDGSAESPSQKWEAVSRTATYRALQRADLTRLATDAGLSRCEWLMPSESGFYQPVFIGRL